jgi:hypothetical protein
MCTMLYISTSCHIALLFRNALLKTVRIGVHLQAKVPISPPFARHRRQRCDADWQLRCVRVCRSRVNFETRFHGLVPQVGPLQHAEHRLAQDFRRIALEHVHGPPLLQPARIARVPPVQLVLPLVARKFHLRRIHHDYRIAHVLVGEKGWLVLAAQYRRNLTRQATDGLTVGVDQMPTALQALAWKRHFYEKGAASALVYSDDLLKCGFPRVSPLESLPPLHSNHYGVVSFHSTGCALLIQYSTTSVITPQWSQYGIDEPVVSIQRQRTAR